MVDRRVILLKNVRYVLKIKRDLLSISMFGGFCYSTKIKHGMLMISNGALIVSKGTKRNGLYILDGYTIISGTRKTKFVE
uniref:Retrovirus-related Pol polyprotein from transposon TNT 1-94 n=1 Tax=Cajanus cajan TaxID=3821 RepID=A0A151RTN1_CAJCA|nr:hypothetical protein KK1_032581 [Cajanus cajan]